MFSLALSSRIYLRARVQGSSLDWTKFGAEPDKCKWTSGVERRPSSPIMRRSEEGIETARLKSSKYLALGAREDLACSLMIVESNYVNFGWDRVERHDGPHNPLEP
eukprot:scaffold161074_cov32-Tisochrysis_lutea.AAC.4